MFTELLRMTKVDVTAAVVTLALSCVCGAAPTAWALVKAVTPIRHHLWLCICWFVSMNALKTSRNSLALSGKPCSVLAFAEYQRTLSNVISETSAHIKY
jgi:hypothetical protein